MAGVDLPEKLRRGLGNGQVVHPDVIAEKMRPFSKKEPDALTLDELAEFLSKGAHVGTPWFCKLVAKTMWHALEAYFSDPITWIKISQLAWWTCQYMAMPPRRAKRVRITPEGAMGWEPLEYLDGTPLESVEQAIKGSSVPQPVVPQNFKRAPEPFTRSPAQARAMPSAAPRGPRAGATPPPRAPTGEPRRPTAAPARPALPRRPGPRK